MMRLFLCTLGFWYPIFFSYYDMLVVEYVVVVYFIRLLGSGRDDYVSFSVLGVMVFIILDLLYDWVEVRVFFKPYAGPIQVHAEWKVCVWLCFHPYLFVGGVLVLAVSMTNEFLAYHVGVGSSRLLCCSIGCSTWSCCDLFIYLRVWIIVDEEVGIVFAYAIGLAKVSFLMLIHISSFPVAMRWWCYLTLGFVLTILVSTGWW